MNGYKVVKEKKFMVKFKIYLIVFLLTSFSFNAQNKTIVPKTGTIVFDKKEIIFDKELYLTSYKELMPKMKKAMKKQLYLERLTDGKKTDTIQLKLEVEKIAQNLEMFLPMLIEEPKEEIKFYHEFKNDTIIQYNTFDGNHQNEKIINKILGTITNEFGEYVENNEAEIIKLTEFRKETKMINGYKCFKVIYNYNEPEVSDFDFLSSVVTHTREVWVTEAIKCNYHPLVHEKLILDKYYPLEITEYSDEIKGAKTIYSQKELLLK